MVTHTVAGLRSGAPEGVKQVARRAAFAAGRATSGLRMLPDFLLVGAQRCGTTSLHRALIRHPAVLPPVLHKGVHYFDTDWTHGDDWYQAHFPLRAHADVRTRRTGARTLTGESSPYYMFHPDGPRRIAATVPHVRAIVLLRDPVERAYSQHAHELARGFESAPFEEAVELESSRLAGEAERLLADPSAVSLSHQHHSYLARGEYAGQLVELHRHLGKDRVLVLDAEELFTEPAGVYAEVLSFLGLPDEPLRELGRHNPRPRAPMAESLRAKLDAHFVSHDERLAALLGHAPSWRR